MQSPKSKRAHGSAEEPSSYGLPEDTIGRKQVSPQGPSGGGPKVPKLDFSSSHGAPGYTPREEHLSGNNPPAETNCGRPGASHSDDAMRTGGLVERFSDSRGTNQ